MDLDAGAAAFRRAVEVMARLRGPSGCPWDAEQTHESLAKYLLEETYETLEAIDAGDLDALRGELGDLLLQVLFHAEIASEAGAFTIADVAEGLSEKLVARHPHGFGDVAVAGADEVVANWERAKRAERQGGVLDGIPQTLPSLARTAKLEARAARVGFEWHEPHDAADKVREELGEVLAADPQDVEEEVGDLLFVSAVLATMLGVEPEDALRKANAKFERRFRAMEERARSEGRELESLSAQEWGEYWEHVK